MADSESTEAASALAGTDVAESGISHLIQDSRNKTAIRCQRCPSLMLNAFQARITEKEIFLPHMHKKSDEQKPEDGETLNNHWVVNDMFTFENIGFSHTVGTSKYLVCADCEVGPVGYQDMNNKTLIYLTLDRVRHSDNV